MSHNTKNIAHHITEVWYSMQINFQKFACI